MTNGVFFNASQGFTFTQKWKFVVVLVCQTSSKLRDAHLKDLFIQK